MNSGKQCGVQHALGGLETVGGLSVHRCRPVQQVKPSFALPPTGG